MSGRGLRPAPLRWTVALIAVADLAWFPAILDEARATATATDAFTWLTDLLSRPLPRLLLIGLGAGAALRFARRPGRLWAGLILLVVLGLLNTVQAQLYGSPWRHLYYGGLCLGGWLLGLGYARRRGAPGDEWYARAGALALLSAAYFNAGLSKLVYAGPQWLLGLPIQAVVVAQDGLAGGGLLGAYRVVVVETPALAAVLASLTVLLELAGPLMLVGPRLRAVVALGLVGMHANIFLMTHIPYWEAVVFLLAFGFSADPPPAAAPVPVPSGSGRRAALAAALLAAVAVAGVVHQSRRYHERQAARPPAGGEPAPPAVQPPERRLRVIGPFRVGQSPAADWAIVGLEPSDTGFIVRLEGGRGAAAFEVTCAESPHRSPFDLDGVHVFYSSALPFEALEEAGVAVRDAVRAAAGGDPCARIGEWRAPAEAPR